MATDPQIASAFRRDLPATACRGLSRFDRHTGTDWPILRGSCPEQRRTSKGVVTESRLPVPGDHELGTIKKLGFS
jgi:hypothetical protein